MRPWDQVSWGLNLGTTTCKLGCVTFDKVHIQVRFSFLNHKIGTILPFLRELRALKWDGIGTKLSEQKRSWLRLST